MLEAIIKLDSWFFAFFGLFGGFTLSFLFWWFMNHRMVPKIAFSPEIARLEVPFFKSGLRYQIAIKNVGQRDAFNVKYRVRLKIHDLMRQGDDIWNNYDIPTKSNEFFILTKGQRHRITPLIHQSPDFQREIFPNSIRQKAVERKLSMDDIFEVYPSSRLFLELVATDRFSGGAKYFTSPDYGLHEIKDGVFEYPGLKIVARAFVATEDGGATSV